MIEKGEIRANNGEWIDRGEHLLTVQTGTYSYLFLSKHSPIEKQSF